jgi:hypothetical protein
MKNERRTRGGDVWRVAGVLCLRLRLAGPFDACALRHWVPWWSVREGGFPFPHKHVLDDDTTKETP